jgi:hypothetical protein
MRASYFGQQLRQVTDCDHSMSTCVQRLPAPAALCSARGTAAPLLPPCQPAAAAHAPQVPANLQAGWPVMHWTPTSQVTRTT